MARAEQALADLSVHFGDWTEEECEQLELARGHIHADGFNRTTAGDLYKAAHDLKGEAATFGFPLVTGAAESLCGLIEHARDKTRIPVALIDHHVETIHTIARMHDRIDARTSTARLMRDLTRATTDYLMGEDLDALEALDDSPPLAPHR